MGVLEQEPGPIERAPARPLPVPAGFFVTLNANDLFDDGASDASPLLPPSLGDSVDAREWVGRWKQGQPVGSDIAEGNFARSLCDLTLGIAQPPIDGPTPSITIVIPVKDRPDELSALLAADFSYPVVVVDDGSRDGSSIRAVAEQYGARLIVNPVSLGPAGARNVGWTASTSDLVCFIDSDVRCDASWIAPIARHFADPLIAAAAPRVLPVPDEAPRFLAAYEQTHSPLDLGARGALVGPGSQVSYLPTAAIVIRSGITDVPFDSTMRTGEDVDFLWRLVAAGWIVRYDPTQSVCHPVRATLWGWINQRFSYGLSAGPLAIRHGRTVIESSPGGDRGRQNETRFSDPVEFVRGKTRALDVGGHTLSILDHLVSAIGVVVGSLRVHDATAVRAMAASLARRVTSATRS